MTDQQLRRHGVTDGQERTDVASRLVRATREDVYGAFADAATLMSWLPPEGMSGRALEYGLSRGRSLPD